MSIKCNCVRTHRFPNTRRFKNAAKHNKRCLAVIDPDTKRILAYYNPKNDRVLDPINLDTIAFSAKSNDYLNGVKRKYEGIYAPEISFLISQEAVECKETIDSNYSTTIEVANAMKRLLELKKRYGVYEYSLGI